MLSYNFLVVGVGLGGLGYYGIGFKGFRAPPSLLPRSRTLPGGPAEPPWAPWHSSCSAHLRAGAVGGLRGGVVFVASSDHVPHLRSEF